MIIEELIEEGRVKHYSDAGMMIRQIETGILYEDAVDILPCRFTYEETDVPIEVEEDSEENLADLARILLGEADE